MAGLGPDVVRDGAEGGLAEAPAATTPHMGPFSLATWNAQALFGTDIARSRRNEARLRAVAPHCSLAFLPEVPCGASLHIGLTGDLGDAFRCLWDPTPHMAHTGGLGFIANDSFAWQFCSIALVEIARGRHATLACTGPRGTLHILGPRPTG